MAYGLWFDRPNFFVNIFLHILMMEEQTPHAGNGPPCLTHSHRIAENLENNGLGKLGNPLPDGGFPVSQPHPTIGSGFGNRVVFPIRLAMRLETWPIILGCRFDRQNVSTTRPSPHTAFKSQHKASSRPVVALFGRQNLREDPRPFSAGAAVIESELLAASMSNCSSAPSSLVRELDFESKSP
jgi:hypothetical protein